MFNQHLSILENRRFSIILGDKFLYDYMNLLEQYLSKPILSIFCRLWCVYTVKKVRGFPVPSRDVTYQTLPWPGKIKLFPAMESMVGDIPAGDWENREPFFTVYRVPFGLFYLNRSTDSRSPPCTPPHLPTSIS